MKNKEQLRVGMTFFAKDNMSGWNQYDEIVIKEVFYDNWFSAERVRASPPAQSFILSDRVHHYFFTKDEFIEECNEIKAIVYNIFAYKGSADLWNHSLKPYLF